MPCTHVIKRLSYLEREFLQWKWNRRIDETKYATRKNKRSTLFFIFSFKKLVVTNLSTSIENTLALKSLLWKCSHIHSERCGRIVKFTSCFTFERTYTCAILFYDYPANQIMFINVGNMLLRVFRTATVLPENILILCAWHIEYVCSITLY